MKKLIKLSRFLKDVGKAQRFYGGSSFGTYARAARLLWREYSPREVFIWGLLDPAISNAELDRYVSKERFLAFQSGISPPDYACLLEDKELFYRFCTAIDFPIPTTIAFLDRERVWLSTGPLEDGVSYLEASLRSLEGRELILKPADGVYGAGIRSFLVRDGSLRTDDESLSPEMLLASLNRGDRYILQHRLYNHPVLDELSGFKTLQVLRIVSALPRAPGAPASVMSASLRLSARESLVNNFDYGRGGNMRVKIDTASGEVVRAVRASPAGFGLEDIDRVPQTGRGLRGVRMPFWQETIALLAAKAPCFYPIRLVGWDVALTPDGPVIIEGNFWFDPAENAFGDVGDFIDAVRTDQPGGGTRS